ILATGEVIGFGQTAVSNPQWSPDGKWVSFTRADATLLPHVYVVSAAGGKERRITGDDSYSETGAHWTPDGKRIVYLSGIDTENIGQRGESTAQLAYISLMPEEKDPTDRAIDSEEDAVAAERTSGGAGRGRGGLGDGVDGAGGMRGRGQAASAKVDVKIDFNKIERRSRQLTRIGDMITSVAISPDSRTYAFVTMGTEGGRRVQS